MSVCRVRHAVRSYSQAALNTVASHHEPHPPAHRPRTTPSAYQEPDPRLSQYLNNLFPGLKFSPELARRLLTHSSHPAAIHGHNGRYAFTGRRHMEMFFQLFLASSKKLSISDDTESIMNRAMDYLAVGEHVGSRWGLASYMVWSPSRSRLDMDAKSAKSSGLYKVQGATVCAVVGGTFEQFGGSTAHRLFHTRILPHLLLGSANPRGLPTAFHEEAQLLCTRMGGPEGSLAPNP